MTQRRMQARRIGLFGAFRGVSKLTVCDYERTVMIVSVFGRLLA
jgi:hypothetical protein